MIMDKLCTFPEFSCKQCQLFLNFMGMGMLFHSPLIYVYQFVDINFELLQN